MIYTENQDLHQSFSNLGYFCSISTLTQSILTKLLNDEEWVDEYFNKSNDTLREQCNETKRVLEALKIPYINPTSALFLVADFRELLKQLYLNNEEEQVSFKIERRFFEELADEEKVILVNFHFLFHSFFEVLKWFLFL